MRPLRIVLADDHSIVREGLKQLLAEQPDMEIVGEARDGEEAFKTAVQLSPDIVVMDIMMPGVNGLEATRQIKKCRPMIKVVGLSISEEISCIKELLTSGAEGFVVKRAAANELAAALRVVHQGGMHIDPRVSASLVGAELNQLHGPQNALSPRENSIIRLVALGYTNKEIATRLDLSVKTVESYKARGMEKAGLRNRVELVRHGAKRGWLTGQD